MEELYNEKYIFATLRPLMSNCNLCVPFLLLRLWNELTIKLIRFVKNDEIQNEDTLVALYHNFITSFESK